MHILATTTASLDDLIEPVDLGQQPADMVALSFSDSDLASLDRAAKADRTLPDLRLAALRDLRHPMSVDLWVERIASQAKVIVVRVLGGYDWWRYGCDRLSETARRHGVKLALLPGECRVEDERLAHLSTMEPAERQALLVCFREGGPENMRRVVERMAMLAGQERAVEEAEPLPRAGYYRPDEAGAGSPVLILFYRSMLLADDVAPIEALADELTARRLKPVPIYVSSLRDAQVEAFLREAVAQHRPAAILTATAFASGAEPGAETLFDTFGLPVFQIVTATTRREAWESGQRGLAPADLAMHVVLPELDGRILAGAISFKEPGLLPGSAQINRPEPDRVAHVARRIANFLRLAQTPPTERKITILLPDYPGAAGRTGYAVGLDVPASVLAMLADLRAAGYTVADIPELPRELMQHLQSSREYIDVTAYKSLLKELAEVAQTQLSATWGEPEADADEDRFAFRALRFGNVTVALAPDRGRSADRRADYHDPALPPRHSLVAFGFWMREIVGSHAIIHVGAHGTLEWLPGKTAALSQNCFPEIVTGALPVIYPFIVSNPGEAAQAKRRIAAVTIGHLTPPLEGAGLSPGQQELERLVDEYSQADGLDRRRRDRLAKLIVETAQKTGLAGEAGVDAADDPDAALVRIDAWLCDLKDFAVKDGLHIFGRAEGDDPTRIQCAEAERTALLAALDGRHIRPGPAGAPARGRTDVLPTGRNLFTSDPRTLPTPTAFALGEKASAEVLRSYMQEHGDWPRALVIDLWGSASLRTGGEEIAQGLALMGCRPQWDPATGRVTGIEVLPPAQLGRPRVDVTWRISGLFRDMFATQIALIDAAVAAVAARDEAEGDNPLATAKRSGQATARIFGSAPGTYGSGVEDKLASGDWDDRAELGRAYLDGASHAFGGHDGEGRHDGSFADRLVEADLLVHNADDPGRDILEGSADVAFIGGFAAAVKVLGGKADLIVLDTTKAETPKARSLAQTINRTVRARALNPRFIAGQLRHGPRGASEFAETVDRLVGFAETTDAVPGALIGDLHTAYLEDETVRAFLLRENPAAARFIAERFASARRRGLWHPLRNSTDDDLAALIAEAEIGEVAA
ncbi:cobaltochelatase subunit CobN [Tianweitania populi]|uniref:Cobaltochelatase subunit CobN n=1 Tax=Tianweitania populi TaxID=1607949 RepID=A0A8J3DP36_9HYPH|nr:cobaltochelatase subunit CobN [Tianweitania populi]GHD08586.1 cobaltochelatase subunit CobN [Tianweitania populi]